MQWNKTKYEIQFKKKVFEQNFLNLDSQSRNGAILTEFMKEWNSVQWVKMIFNFHRTTKIYCRLGAYDRLREFNIYDGLEVNGF